MEAKGYEYIPWNDERNTTGGPGYYRKTSLTLPAINGKAFEIPKLHHHKPVMDWNFLINTAIELECKIDTSKQNSLDKAIDKLYRFCYKKLNKVPKNQLSMFDQKTCACGKNPECMCNKC